MAIIKEEKNVGGAWLDKKIVETGDQVKIKSEADYIDGEYNGEPQRRLVAKVSVEDKTTDALNFAINKPTASALISAFGENSADWIDQITTAYVEDTRIGGKLVRVMYLVPEGYEAINDENGYLVVRPKA